MDSHTKRHACQSNDLINNNNLVLLFVCSLNPIRQTFIPQTIYPLLHISPFTIHVNFTTVYSAYLFQAVHDTCLLYRNKSNNAGLVILSPSYNMYIMHYKLIVQALNIKIPWHIKIKSGINNQNACLKNTMGYKSEI